MSQRVGYLGISKSTESKRVKLTNLTPAPPSIFHVYACSGVGLYRITLRDEGNMRRLRVVVRLFWRTLLYESYST